jgi:lipopolysaccharide export LptBFGC system permease protein LptF
MTESFTPSSTLRPNPITQRKHHQEVLWQITLPLCVGAALVLAAAVGVVIAGASGAGDIGRWASVSLIGLILPAMFFTFIFLVVIAALAYGLIRLIGVLPSYTRRIQDFFVLVETRVKKAADASVEPVLRAQGFTAGLRALRRK